jgi:hypothetical protein
MDIADLVKRAQEAQGKAQALQAQMAQLEMEGTAGGGLVRVTLNGKSELKKIAIDPSLLKPEDREMVEDLVVAAHNDAKTKLDRRVNEEMGRLAQGLGLPPGFGLG